jgi:hypothetical protein
MTSEQKHINATYLERTVEGDKLKTRNGSKGHKIGVRPDLRRSATKLAVRTKFSLDALRLRKKFDATVRPNLVPKLPRPRSSFLHAFHDLGRRQPETVSWVNR